MRDKRFIAVHRGGPLTKENHKKLIRWARECSEHVLALIVENPDPRLLYALYIAKEWEAGNASVGEARKAIRLVCKSTDEEFAWQMAVSEQIGCETVIPDIKLLNYGIYTSTRAKSNRF
jgi:hypothetical protein